MPFGGTCWVAIPEQLVILPDARHDLAEGFEWYEAQAPGLGQEFFRCAEACIHSVQRTPRLYPVVHDRYRRALVRRFPYAVFYEHAQHVITVYAVFHCAQAPDKWKARMT